MTRRWTVGPVWRLVGAALVAGFLALTMQNQTAFDALFRLDARLIDLWQRIAPPDAPSGEVIVVGIDDLAIRENGRWPWARDDLADLVERVVAAGPKSITLDILLTEPGPYSDVGLFRMFGGDAPEIIDRRGPSPDRRLAAAIGSAPTALAAAGGAAKAVASAPAQTECVDPALLQGPEAKPYYVECVLFPLDGFLKNAKSVAVGFAESDLDGIVRRARAFVALPYLDETGARREAILPAMPVAALTACAADDRGCLAYDPALPFLTAAAGGWTGFSLPLAAADGSGPPPTPLTRGLGFWIDFGVLGALGERADGTGIASAGAVLLDDAAVTARLTGKHVLVGLTRLGSIDQHATPMATQSGAPGVVIQAVAADNILTGRVLEEPVWARIVAFVAAGAMGVLALLRFGVAHLPTLLAVGATLIVGPLVVSWAAFEHGRTIVFAAAPTIAALLAGVPVMIGRVAAIRRDLAVEEDARTRDEERMDAARRIQLGSLPFEADFTALGVETASICRPAQEVGGDFFELFQLSDGRIFAAVGDVSGKGLEASLVTALSKSISGAVTDRTPGPLGDALAEIAREFVRQAPLDWRRDKGGFVTLAALRLDPRTGDVEFAAAGCDPPTLIGANGRSRAVDLPAVAPLGWIERPRFETARATLSSGDLVAMFTDGVTEAEAPSGTLFGDEAAMRVLSAAAPEGANAALNALHEAVAAHQAGGEPTDDTTILCLRWTGISSDPPTSI